MIAFILASALTLALPLLQDADKAAPPAGPTEKQLLTDFNKAFGNKDVAQRVAALTALGDLTRTTPEAGTSKAVAKALAKGLEDDELEVRAAAVGQLAWGRDVDTVINAFKKFMEDQRTQIDRRMGRPDDESKAYINRGTAVFNNACRAISNYRDDRTEEMLSSLLRSLRANSESNNTATRLVGGLARATLEMGTADAVDAAVKQTQTYTGDYQEPAARRLHEALASFATKAGAAPPEWSDLFYVSWQNWFQEHKDKFPKKLGKLKEPPPQRPYEEPEEPMSVDGTDGGPAPR
ncbi:MAG: hypothetical protein ACT4PU_03375 [Planctomycetota bacterium]